MERLRAYVYKLGQNVYIDVNYVDVYLLCRRGATRARSSRSKYTYRSSVRLGNPFQTINKKKELYLL